MTGSDEAPWGPISKITFDLETDDGTERLGEVNLSKHTPGPWSYNMRGQIAPCKEGDMFLDLHRQVAAVYAHGGQADVTKANARLIAAAPDMLAQLKRNAQGLRNLLEFDWITDEGHREWIQEAINEVDAVVDKAEGKT